jgi:flagellar biosynthetic protein FliP
MNKNIIFWLIILSCLFSVSSAEAGPDLGAVTMTTTPGGGQTYSINLQILILMTVLTLLPAGLLMMTSFTRIIIVLALLRQALGTQQTPTNQTLIGLALFLTYFVMSPVIDKVNVDAVAPYLKDQISFQEGLSKAQAPFRKFMFAQTRENDLSLFLDLSGATGNGKPTAENVPFSVLVPAFITSELKTAFQIGFMIFIPFLIIDLVVASVLMAMGMMMLSPLIISLPFKIMLFVLVDGWTLVIGTLASSFYR